MLNPFQQFSSYYALTKRQTRSFDKTNGRIWDGTKSKENKVPDS
jgi:hypothetical protein